MKKIYRKVIRFEILSEEPIPEMDLNDIAYETSEGHMSGKFLENEVDNEELSGSVAVGYIKAQGSSPEFFMLDDEGNEIE